MLGMTQTKVIYCVSTPYGESG